MPTWHLLVIAYFTYVAGLGLIVPTRAPWRLAPVAACATLPALGLPAAAEGTARIALDIVIPSLFLISSYWLSGLFFTRPATRVEAFLLDGDQWLLPRLGLDRVIARGPRVILEALEFSYLLVYLMVPAGALVVAVGQPGQLSHYWAVVFGAVLPCYAMMPWLQTRPPRTVEPEDPFRGRTPWFRAANLAVLSRGSHQANTVPSGHAAGAVAAALAVTSGLPPVGVAFLTLAATIAVATVVGRYHYAIDTLIGVALAVTAWALMG